MRIKNLIKCFFLLAGLCSSIPIQAQEPGIELMINSSDNKWLYKGYGLRLSYNQFLSGRFHAEISAGVTRFEADFCEAVFNPDLSGFMEVRSESFRYSAELRTHFMLLGNEKASFSMGPLLSYNHLDGTQHVLAILFSDQDPVIYDEGIPHRNSLGCGVHAQMKVRDFPFNRASVVMNIRTDYGLTGNGFKMRGIAAKPYDGTLFFIETGIGIIYNLTGYN